MLGYTMECLREDTWIDLPAKFLRCKRAGLDTESDGPTQITGQMNRLKTRPDEDKVKKMIDMYRSTTVGFSIAFPDKTSYYVPLQHKKNNVPYYWGIQALRDILKIAREEGYPIGIHNLSHELKAFQRLGIIEEVRTNGSLHCTLVSAWMAGYDAKMSWSLGLKHLSKRLFSHEMSTFDTVVGGTGSFGVLDPRSEDSTNYACEDAIAALELMERTQPTLKSWGLEQWFNEVEMPFVWVLNHCTDTGIPIDAEGFSQLHHEAADEVWRTRELGQKMLGVDVGSTKSLQKMFEEGYWVPGGEPDKKGNYKQGKSGQYPVNKDVWDDIVERTALITDKQKRSIGQDMIKVVEDYKSVAKVYSTYSANLVRLAAHSHDGKLHPGFKHAGVSCLPLNCPVLTDRGYTPAGKVRVGDKTISHTGRERTITDVIDNGVQPIYTVTTGGRAMRCTGNHPFLTTRQGAPVWVEARDLVIGDMVEVFGSRERWAHTGFGDYSVSSWGRVRHSTHGFVTGYRKNKWGHVKVCLARNGAQRRGPDRKDFAVHRLVAAAFVPNPQNKPEVRHINGIGFDNRSENLVWGTSSENTQDAIEHGSVRGLKGPNVFFTLGALLDSGSFTSIGKRWGVCRKAVARLKKRGCLEVLPYTPKVAYGFQTVRVLSVTVAKPEPTLGLTVEEDHSHITAGFVTHNTGRIASSNPNATNMPSRGDAAKRIVQNLCAPEGQLLISSDYSQIDLRVLAHFAGGTTREAFQDVTRDPHQELADDIGTTRDNAKTVMYLTIFGGGPGRLSTVLNIPKAEASLILKNFKEMRPEVGKMNAKIVASAYRKGYVKTLAGRRKQLPQLLKMDPKRVWQLDGDIKSFYQSLERKAQNLVPQGGSADVVKYAMVKMFLTGLPNDMRMVTQIHDDIRVQTGEQYVEEGMEFIQEHMEAAQRNEYWDLSVPLVAEPVAGKNWKELK